MSDKKCCAKNKNPEHSKQLPNINKIMGQLEGIKRMIEENRYCPDILIQLMAIRSAVKSVSSKILKTHLESCVAQSFESEEDRDKKIDEIKMLFDKFSA